MIASCSVNIFWSDSHFSESGALSIFGGNAAKWFVRGHAGYQLEHSGYMDLYIFCFSDVFIVFFSTLHSIVQRACKITRKMFWAENTKFGE